MDTIIALASPAGLAGVGVIRISGEKSLDILKKLTKKEDFIPRYMYLCKIDVDNFFEDALCVYFKAPHSFTGEDVVEIQMHSGYYIIEQMINKCIELGCVMATKGEFSKRAFLNGKMSLDKAEGIIDLINAESEMQVKASSNLSQGKLTNLVNKIQLELIDVIAEFEAKIDYPEYDFNNTEIDKILNILDKNLELLNSLSNKSKTGVLIKNGVKIAIVGNPNVGKSSLMNNLIGKDKSIVTDIAGTTRDIVEGEYEYKGIIFRLFDTAGIHESKDKVEQIGIERALKTIDQADLVIRLSTINEPCNVNVKGKYLDVINKTDLLDNFKEDKNKIYISVLQNKNIDYLKDRIFEMCIDANDFSDSLILTNDRHISKVKQAVEYLTQAKENLKKQQTFDLIASDLKNAWQSLGEITGKVSNELIIDRIFEKFCLGK